MLTKFICCIIIQNSRIFIFQQTKNFDEKGTLLAPTTEHLLNSDLRYGKTIEGLLTLNGSMGINAGVVKGTTLTTLPDGYRPTIPKWLIGMCIYDDNTREPIQVYLSVNGELKVYPTNVAQMYSIFIDSAIFLK